MDGNSSFEVHNPFSDSARQSFRSYTPHSGDSASAQPRTKRRFESYKLAAEYERPWVHDERLNKTRIGNYIIWGFIALGLLVSAYINFRAVKNIRRNQYCLILDDSFLSLDKSSWNLEVQVNGFGTGSFEWTTTDAENVFVDSQGLHLVPTLTNETTPITNTEIFNGYTLNLTKIGGDGSCTGTTITECSVHSNETLGTVIPPVRSARLNTRGKKGIRYGRVEVVAKMPEGDWLWPAIWMLPVQDIYGGWPASGEIDIAESRGNNDSYLSGGRNTISSSLHWGPTPSTDAFWRSTQGKSLRRSDFTRDFHIFGMVWSDSYLYTYVDDPLYRVMAIEFKKGTTMWQQGLFPATSSDGTLLLDPWSQNGRPNTPFDQEFYLILDVAVGGTNGYFEDGIGNKPWTDAGNAAFDFYRSSNEWLPTWPTDKNQRGMIVQSVKMWQEGSCG